MADRITVCLTAVLLLIFMHCTKNDKEPAEGGVMISLEKMQTDVNPAHVFWEKSISVFTEVSGSDKEINHSLADFYNRMMLSKLSQGKKIKVLLPESEDFTDKRADFFLKTDLHRNGSKLQGSVFLISTENDSILYTKLIKTSMDSLIFLEREITGDIAESLGMKIDNSTFSGKTILKNDLFSEYLKVNYLLKSDEREKINLAVKGFKEIIKTDSTFTPAYIGLTECYLKIVHNKWDRNLVWLRLAQQTALKALQFKNSPRAHALLAEIYLKRGDYRNAEKEYKQALQLNSNFAEAWAGLGKIFSWYGLYKPGLQAYSKALELNPDDVNSSVSLCMIQIGFKQYDKAEHTVLNCLARKKSDLSLYVFSGLINYYQKNYRIAEQETKKALRGDKYKPLAHAVLGMIYARQGDNDKALGEVELEVKPFAAANSSLATAVAAVYSVLGRDGLAVQWLEKAYSRGYKEYPWLVNDPNFDNLREDKRFILLMEKIKIEWENSLKNYRSKLEKG